MRSDDLEGQPGTMQIYSTQEERMRVLWRGDLLSCCELIRADGYVYGTGNKGDIYKGNNDDNDDDTDMNNDDDG